MSTEEQIIGPRKKKIPLSLLKVMLIDKVICCPRRPKDEEPGEGGCLWGGIPSPAALRGACVCSAFSPLAFQQC